MNAGAPGVGCGAAILRDGRLLLVKRLKPPEAGCWSLPDKHERFVWADLDAPPAPLAIAAREAVARLKETESRAERSD